MGKRVLFFYGINLSITFILAMIFGGVLGSIKGNELILGMIVTMGVQLSLLVTSLIYRKKYHEKRNYNYNFNKYIVLSVIIPVSKHVPICLSISIPNCSITNINVCAHAGDAGSTKL